MSTIVASLRYHLLVCELVIILTSIFRSPVLFVSIEVEVSITALPDLFVMFIKDTNISVTVYPVHYVSMVINIRANVYISTTVHSVPYVSFVINIRDNIYISATVHPMPYVIFIGISDKSTYQLPFIPCPTLFLL